MGGVDVLAFGMRMRSSIWQRLIKYRRPMRTEFNFPSWIQIKIVRVDRRRKAAASLVVSMVARLIMRILLVSMYCIEMKIPDVGVVFSFQAQQGSTPQS